MNKSSLEERRPGAARTPATRRPRRKTGRSLLVLVLCAAALWGAAPAWAVLNATILPNVPDWQQPAGLNSNGVPCYPDFVQPVDPPPAAGGVAEWCTPTAMSNVLGWWQDTKGVAGIADGVAWPNTIAGGYPNNDTNAQNPHVSDNVADWQQSQWHDGVIELGFAMDTQGWRTNNAAQRGTNIGNIIPGFGGIPNGFIGYRKTYAPESAWFIQNRVNGQLNAQQGWNDYLNGSYGSGVNNVPVLVHWTEWIDPTRTNSYEAEGITFYDWSATVTGIGHTVTGVGFYQGDPDGQKGPMPNANWAIVHDNWATTPTTVAVPWSFVNPWGITVSYWQANTHLQKVVLKFKNRLAPNLASGNGRPSVSGSSPWNQWAADRWTAESNEPVSGLHWWGVDLDPNAEAGPWTFSIYANVPGLDQPGAKLWTLTLADMDVGAMPTGYTDAYGNLINEYYANFPQGSLFAEVMGDNYWLQIDRELPNSPNGWGWLTSEATGTHMVTSDGYMWAPGSGGSHLAFEIGVPEPGTLVLLTAGAAAWALVRRAKCRRRSAANWAT